jgi:hypothetical protein
MTNKRRPHGVTLKCNVALIAPPLGLIVLGACSGGTTPSTPTCGPGTLLRSGECVVAATNEGGSDEGGAPLEDSSDSPQPDGEAEAKSADAATVDSSSADAAADSPTGSSADPCPSSTYTVLQNCDPTCGALTTSCANSTCQTGIHSSLGTSAQNPLPAVIRTPDAPTTDPACHSKCPTSAFTYGLGYLVDFPAVNIHVSPPWLVAYYPLAVGIDPNYCLAASQLSSCVHIPAGTQSLLYIMTTAPSPPARNVYIEAASSCP